MMWLFVICAVVAVALTVAVATGRLDGGVSAGLPAAASSLPHEGLPDGPLDGQDVAALRFDVGVRGYRMAQVDAVMDRLRDELDQARAEIGRLRDAADDRRAAQELAAPVGVVAGSAGAANQSREEPPTGVEEASSSAASQPDSASDWTGSASSEDGPADGAGADE